MKIRFESESRGLHQQPDLNVFLDKEDGSAETKLGSYRITPTGFDVRLHDEGFGQINFGVINKTDVFAALLTVGDAAIKDKHKVGLLYYAAAEKQIGNLSRQCVYFSSSAEYPRSDTWLDVLVKPELAEFVRSTQAEIRDAMKKDFHGMIEALQKIDAKLVTAPKDDLSDRLYEYTCDKTAIGGLKWGVKSALDSLSKAQLIFEGKFEEVTKMVSPSCPAK